MSLRGDNCFHLSLDHARMMPPRVPLCRDTARSMMRILTARATQRLLIQLQVGGGLRFRELKSPMCPLLVII